MTLTFTGNLVFSFRCDCLDKHSGCICTLVFAHAADFVFAFQAQISTLMLTDLSLGASRVVRVWETEMYNKLVCQVASYFYALQVSRNETFNQWAFVKFCPNGSSSNRIVKLPVPSADLQAITCLVGCTSGILAVERGGDCHKFEIKTKIWLKCNVQLCDIDWISSNADNVYFSREKQLFRFDLFDEIVSCVAPFDAESHLLEEDYDVVVDNVVHLTRGNTILRFNLDEQVWESPIEFPADVTFKKAFGKKFDAKLIISGFESAILPKRTVVF